MIKNILVVRNDRFGEFLLNIPAFRALKQTFVSARIIAVVNPSVKELAECIPFIDESITWESTKHSWAEKLRLARQLKKRKIDLAVIFNPSQEFNIITFLAGIPERVGYDRKWPFLLTRKIADEKHLARKHEVEYNLDLAAVAIGSDAARSCAAAAAGAQAADKTLSLSIDASIIRPVVKKYEIRDEDKIVALHPFTSDPVKQWPLERFVESAKRIAAELNLKVVIIGGPEESGKSRELFGRIADKRIIDLVGLTTLKELAALLRRCALLVSGDSGPVHLACCVQTPVLVLFRNDLPGKTPQRWGPWGAGNIVIEKDSLDKISVDEVLIKIKGKLGII